MTSDKKHKRALQLIEAGQEIAEKPDKGDPVFMARELVQATLPHQNPRGNPRIWSRRNGKYLLVIQPHIEIDHDTGEERCLGYPYGVIPRLLMFLITTEAKRKKTPRLALGDTLSDFMRQINLNPRQGRDGKRLREQMNRLFRAKISFDYAEEGHKKWLDMQVAPKGEMWWDPKQPDQQALFGSWIELGQDFYQAITAHPVPVDMRALRMLKNSPLKLDLYAWFTYKTWQVIHQRNGRPLRVPWVGLAQQLGASYADIDNFRKRAKATIRQIQAVYPGLQVDYVHGGLVIRVGRLSIPELENDEQLTLIE